MLPHKVTKLQHVLLPGRTSPDDVSFACRVLVGVSFSNVSLNERANFRDGHFAGAVSFKNSRIQNSVHFDGSPVPAKDHLSAEQLSRVT